MVRYSPIVHALQELITRNVSSAGLTQDKCVALVNKVNHLANAVREAHNSETRNTKELRDLSLFAYRNILDAAHHLKFAFETVAKDSSIYGDIAVAHYDLAIVYLRLATNQHQVIVSKYEGQ